MATHQRLGDLAEALEAEGADELRVHVVRRAREFKRSWVMMAEALVEVRNRESYLSWGYEDFYTYCSLELQLKQAAADKLTGSYVALERHAPSVLKRDGLNERIPTCDAVDYFAKALQRNPSNDDGARDGRPGRGRAPPSGDRCHGAPPPTARPRRASPRARRRR